MVRQMLPVKSNGDYYVLRPVAGQNQQCFSQWLGLIPKGGNCMAMVPKLDNVP